MATTTSQINEIKEDLSDAYTALGAKGATLPESNARGTANLASTISTVPSPDPVNKAFDVVDGAISAPKNITFSDNTFADITSIGSYALYYEYYCRSANASNPGGVINFDNVTSISTYGLHNAFGSCNIASVSFNSLVQLKDDFSLSSSFKYNDNLTSISFPSLNSITGKYALTYCFNNCDSLTSVSFPELETASGYSCLDSFLSECNSLTTASFPKLKTLGGNSCYNIFDRDTALTSVDFPVLTSMESSGLYYAFSGCKSLTTISFPSLTTVGSSSFSYCFQNCTALTTISFPALTTVQSNSFTNCFKNCTNLTSIHFPASMQSTIEATTGYSSKWGATNATIYFDL